ncbi:MFS transporter [Paenibacillus illinoisensis]|uniref:MFS transporter n=1 Tax=Paenibacillus illinoisensis TaxID=59845 RepID=UPI000FD7A8ED|nr:MFS transporter [Paenibacillus illinoisensis]
MSKERKEQIWTVDFIVTCMSSFFMFTTFYVLATAFPLYVKDIFHGNQQQMGLAITIYVIGGVILRPISGLWVDRLGKRKMAIVGMLIFLISCISYFGTSGLFIFLFIRLFHGMSYALASTATTTIASSLIPNSRQGEGMGYFSLFMSVAMVIGPALGLFLWKDKNENTLLMTVTAIAAVSFIFTMLIRVKREKEPDKNTEIAKEKHRLRWSDIIEPKALPISLVAFVLSFSYSSLAGFIASYMEEIHHTRVTGYFFMVFGMLIIVTRPIIGKVFDKYKEHYLYYPGILLFSAGMLLLSQAHSGTVIILAAIIMGTGYGALLPCFQTLAMQLAPEHRRGSAIGTFFVLFDLGYGLGSYFMGVIVSVSSFRTMYLIAGLITLFSVIIYYLVHHRHDQTR